MSDMVIVGILSLVGTAIGAFGGIMTANKLTNYRVEQLEKKVDKHNSVIERVAVLERDEKTIFGKLDDLRDNLNQTNEGLRSEIHDLVKLCKEGAQNGI